MRLADRRVHPAAFNHVPVVVCDRAWLKVVGINARRIIALVTYAQPLWYWPYAQLVSRAMGFFMLINTISKMIFMATPFPTKSRLLDILADLKDGDSYGATRKQARE